MDILWWYHWWHQKKYISRAEIEKMKKIMRKVPLISEKNDKYSLKEQIEADNYLNTILSDTSHTSW